MPVAVNKNGITVLYEAESPAIEYVKPSGGLLHAPTIFLALANLGPDSIVFVHGFTGDPELTWTLKNAKQGFSSDQGIIPKPTGPDGSVPTPTMTKHTLSSDITTDATNNHKERPFKFRRLLTGRTARETQEHVDTLATASRRDVFWPQDLLPSTIPNARVLTYGYDTKIRHTFLGAVSQNTVSDHGWELLCALTDARRDSPSRPLLFVAHSLGGLVAKIALMKSKESEDVKPRQPRLHHIMASTIGVFFFGTPHRGADPLGPVIRRTLIALAKGFGVKVNDKIVETLMPSNEYLKEIGHSFLNLAKQRTWAIYSFQEEYGVGGLAGKKVSKITYNFALP